MGKYSNLVIEWENGISDWDDDDCDQAEWEKEQIKIHTLETKQDIVKYYLEWRGFNETKYLMEHLLYFIASLD